MTLVSQAQTDWGGGIYRGRNAPANSFYDGTDILIDDEGHALKRGGSALLSTSDAASTLRGLSALSLDAGQRVLAIGSANVYVLNGTTPLSLGTGVTQPLARYFSLGGVAVIPNAASAGFGYNLYAGSYKTSGYSTGTVTITKNSKSVTGSGTSWSSNADAGMFIGPVGS